MLFRTWDVLLEAKKQDEPKKDDFEDLSGGDKEEEPTDYTADSPDDTEDPAPDDTPSEDSDTTDGDEPTDYTTETEEEPAADDAEPDAAPDDSDPATDDSDTTDPETDDTEDVNENRNNKVLIGDFVSLYYRCGSFLQKIEGIEKNNLIVNQIVVKVTSNIKTIESAIFEYIRLGMKKRTYTQNLLRYNQFIEGLRINVEMLEKISVFSENKQNK